MSENLPTASLSKLAIEINAEHQAAEQAARSAIQHALAAGRLLTEAKALCPHGEWSPWLRDNFRGSERTAQAYMRVAKHWSTLEAKAQSSADLTIDAALRLLAEPKPTVSDEMPWPWERRVNELYDRFKEAETSDDIEFLASVAKDAETLTAEIYADKMRCKEILDSMEADLRPFFRILDGCKFDDPARARVEFLHYVRFVWANQSSAEWRAFIDKMFAETEGTAS